MVDVAGLDDRSPETAGDADGDPLLPEDRGRDVWTAEAVLNRENERSGSDERARGLGGRSHVERLGGDDDELGLTGLAGVGRCPKADDPIAARALDAEAMFADRVDVRDPAIDRPDFVPGTPEQPGVDGAHRAGSDDRDLHRCDHLRMERIALFWQRA